MKASVEKAQILLEELESDRKQILTFLSNGGTDPTAWERGKFIDMLIAKLITPEEPVEEQKEE